MLNQVFSSKVFTPQNRAIVLKKWVSKALDLPLDVSNRQLAKKINSLKPDQHYTLLRSTIGDGLLYLSTKENIDAAIVNEVGASIKHKKYSLSDMIAAVYKKAGSSLNQKEILPKH